MVQSTACLQKKSGRLPLCKQLFLNASYQVDLWAVQPTIRVDAAKCLVGHATERITDLCSGEPALTQTVLSSERSPLACAGAIKYRRLMQVSSSYFMRPRPRGACLMP